MVNTCFENGVFYAFANVKFQEVGYAESTVSREDALLKLAMSLAQRLDNINKALTEQK